MANEIGINFHLRGQSKYAYRQWLAVPRVGDIVMLHNPKLEEGMRYPAIVRLVVWGTREESWAGKMLECDVYIEWAEGGEVRIPWSTPSTQEPTNGK